VDARKFLISNYYFLMNTNIIDIIFSKRIQYIMISMYKFNVQLFLGKKL